MAFGMRQDLNRIPPNMEPQNYITYRVLAPLRTHWRHATCAEVDCPAYLNGWVTTIDPMTELGQKQSYFIEHDGSRRWRKSVTETGLVKYGFEAGQRCFGADQHKVQVKQDIFLAQGGDWRGNPLGIKRVHTRAEHWVEDFAENQDKIKTVVERG